MGRIAFFKFVFRISTSECNWMQEMYRVNAVNAARIDWMQWMQLRNSLQETTRRALDLSAQGVLWRLRPYELKYFCIEPGLLRPGSVHPQKLTSYTVRLVPQRQVVSSVSREEIGLQMIKLNKVSLFYSNPIANSKHYRVNFLTVIWSLVRSYLSNKQQFTGYVRYYSFPPGQASTENHFPRSN